MTPQEADAVAALCLLAAMADGQKHDAERDKLKEVFASLDDANHAAVYQNVLMKRTDLPREAARLTTPELQTLAYEMAVCVCDADGVTSPAEKTFLNQLRDALTLPPDQAQRTLADAEAMAIIPLDDEPAQPMARSVQPPAVDPHAAEIDSMVLKYAILNGGLELLPQSLATMAILPLQMKMVYRIGKRYGYEMDRGHIKEFLAVIGIGATAQVVENFARKLFGGFLKHAGGKMFGKVGQTAAGAAMSFATTYALGQVAQTYYAGGRTLSAVDLKGLFSRQVQSAQGLYAQHAPQVESTAQQIDVKQILNMVRGQ